MPTPIMYACAKFITSGPSGGVFPHTETFTGIVDASTGTPFEVRSMLLMGGNAPTNALTYWGMSSTTDQYYGDSGFHWDMGFYHDGGEGSNGSGECNDFGIKVCSGAVGWGFSYMDTWPDIFFGGYIAGFGYVNNIVPGSFDITWPSRKDRFGASKIILCFGGPSYDIHVIAGAASGFHGPPIHIFDGPPQGIIQISAAYDTSNDGPASTGAGGSTYVAGFDTRDGDRGAMYGSCGNQNGNSSQHRDDVMNSDGAYVDTWGTDYYNITNGTGGGGLQVVWNGTDTICKGGHITCPATDSTISFNIGILDAKAIIFQSSGTAVSNVTDTTRANFTYGWVDRDLVQGSFWSGETTTGVTVTPLLGSRYLSTSTISRTGNSNGAATTFQNIATVTSFDYNGDVTVAFTNTDGTMPDIGWFALGVAAESAILGTLQVDKVWEALAAGQVTLKVGTAPGLSDIASLTTGPGGTAPLTLGPLDLPNAVYYISETDENLYDVQYDVVINGVPVPIGPEGQVSLTGGDVIVVTITNSTHLHPHRPKQWALHEFNLKIRSEERA